MIAVWAVLAWTCAFPTAYALTYATRRRRPVLEAAAIATAGTIIVAIVQALADLSVARPSIAASDVVAGLMLLAWCIIAAAIIGWRITRESAGAAIVAATTGAAVLTTGVLVALMAALS